jgi:hypothetical protein
MFHCELQSLSRYSDSPMAGLSQVRIPIGARLLVPVKTDTRGATSPLYNGYCVIRGSKAAGT